jgi:hypothetical protein
LKANAKDYVRQSQERLICQPILQQLEWRVGVGGAEKRLIGLLDGWRNRPEADQGMGLAMWSTCCGWSAAICAAWT